MLRQIILFKKKYSSSIVDIADISNKPNTFVLIISTNKQVKFYFSNTIMGRISLYGYVYYSSAA